MLPNGFHRWCKYFNDWHLQEWIEWLCNWINLSILSIKNHRNYEILEDRKLRIDFNNKAVFIAWFQKTFQLKLLKTNCNQVGWNEWKCRYILQLSMLKSNEYRRVIKHAMIVNCFLFSIGVLVFKTIASIKSRLKKDPLKKLSLYILEQNTQSIRVCQEIWAAFIFIKSCIALCIIGIFSVMNLKWSKRKSSS